MSGKSNQETSKVGCFQCGWCCRYYKIFVGPDEAMRISDETGIPLREMTEYDIDCNWFGEENLYLLKGAGGCIFLKNIPGTMRTICGVHAIKPEVCRNFAGSFEKPACRMGLEEVWRLKYGESGQIEGDEARLREFYDLIKEINGE